jgi:hypothetical protein
VVGNPAVERGHAGHWLGAQRFHIVEPSLPIAPDLLLPSYLTYPHTRVNDSNSSARYFFRFVTLFATKFWPPWKVMEHRNVAIIGAGMCYLVQPPIALLSEVKMQSWYSNRCLQMLDRMVWPFSGKNIYSGSSRRRSHRP